MHGERKHGQRKCSAGFTLVELLVVTIVIAILITLVSWAAAKLISKAKQTAMYAEETQMQLAVQSMMTGLGTQIYPPCDLHFTTTTSTTDPIYLYFRRVFPRYNTTLLYSHMIDATRGGFAAADLTTFDPGLALPFWLAGFNPDPTDPLKGHKDRMSGVDSSARYFPFVPERLLGTGGVGTVGSPPFRYLQYGTKSSEGLTDGTKYRGYLYFDNGKYGTAYSGFNAYKMTSTANYNPDSCQIICAGLDGLLGAGGLPGATGFVNTNDADNITNFAGGKEMQTYLETR